MCGGDEGLQQQLPAAAAVISTSAVFPELRSPSPVQLTVWCKSLLFHGHGYTVYDSGGRVLFRVENYAHDWRQETVLMDNSGNVLITVRRRRYKILSFMSESWEALEGDNYKAGGGIIGVLQRRKRRRVLFKARKDLGNSSCTVSMASTNGNAIDHHLHDLGYRMSWSRHKEQFTIHHMDANTTLVAEMSRKYCTSPKKMHLLDKDVFRLIVQPGMDLAVVMAIVMITNSMR